MAERLLLSILLALQCAGVLAVAPGDALPPVRIAESGELRLEGEQLRFAPWDTHALGGKLQIIQYLAARKSSQDINRPFTDRLKASGIPLEHYHLTTIVNLDDAMFGTRGFVMSELERNKRRYFRSTIVADDGGIGRTAWGLAEKSSAIFVLDAEGRVLFFREGAMTEAEIEHVLDMLRNG
jgi:YtfJ family uncharacterized protein